MKKVLIMTSLVFSSVLHSIAADTGAKGETKTAATEKTVSGSNKVSALSARQRANNLTDQMVKELKLNNYQTRKLRAINLDKINQMMAIEASGQDPNAIDKDCKGVCKERDRELESILSTEQYSHYFNKRPDYYKSDKQYAFGGNLEKTTASADTDSKTDDADNTKNAIASK